MSANKRQFGVWMDTHNAIIIGRENTDSEEFVVLENLTNKGAANNSSENAANNHEITLMHKFFKEITSAMTNPEQIHVTGTGQIQEQFLHYLADTAQYKNVDATDSTTDKMNDHEALKFFEEHFN
jgi:stalled ribosome rescue protein Dom34